VSDRFLDSSVPKPEFTALGHAGSDSFIGLETFPNPGVSFVTMTSDEVTAVCPITGQPDWYIVEIAYFPEEKCIESKSLKLYLANFRQMGAFVEALAVTIRDAVTEILEVEEGQVQVTMTQKSRGGISIKARA
jgi:7-cyano-7-deazaguanine reductase